MNIKRKSIRNTLLTVAVIIFLLNTSEERQREAVSDRILKSITREIKNDIQDHIEEVKINNKPQSLRYEYMNRVYYIKIEADENQQVHYTVSNLDQLTYYNFFLFSTLIHHHKIVSFGMFRTTLITLNYLKIL
jgi:hypothetical protein